MMRSVVSAYALALLAAFLAVIAAVAYVNFRIDSNGIFHVNRLAYGDLAEQIFNAKYGITVKGGDIRFIKLAMIEKSTAGCYVNGSSRQMELNIENWPAAKEYGCKDLLNVGVYYSAYEDKVIQMAALLDNPHFETLFLAMDPWIFRKKKTRRFEVMASVHLAAREKLGLPDDKEYTPAQEASAKSYAEVINFSYFVHNLRLLLSGESAATQLVGIPLKEELPEGRVAQKILRSDGSRKRNIGSYEKQVARGRYFDGANVKPPHVSEEVVEEFRTILKRVQSAGKKIAFVLNPYSPEVWECRGDPRSKVYLNNARTCEGLRQSEAAIRKLAAEFRIDVFGSFNPTVAGVVSDDFLDGYHMREEALRKIRLTTGASLASR
jgi:hypothetical protein